MKKKIFIFLGIILFLGLIILSLFYHYNVIILIENASPDDDIIDMHIMYDDEIIVQDTFSYSTVTPNYKAFYVHIPRGKHLIKAKSNMAKTEEAKIYNFPMKRVYIIVNYKNWKVDLPDSVKFDSIKNKYIVNEKEITIGITPNKIKLH